MYFLIAWLLLFCPLCDSYLGPSPFIVKSLTNPVGNTLHRRLDESLAFLSFGLRSSMLPIPAPTVIPRGYETPTFFEASEILSSSKVASSLPTEESFPWTNSVVASRDLTYMPTFLNQLNVIKQLGMTEDDVSAPFREKHSSIKPARIRNLSFQNEKFRKVRMTYFDAGDNVQVFNTLWYPHYHYDLPLLGVDLISLGKNRVLTVVDFQPLHPTKEYFDKYIAQLSTIRDKYSDLQGTLSGKIYNDTSFFSANMLFGRFSDESKIDSTVYPAFQEYLAAYLQLADQATPNYEAEKMKVVKERQTAYDIYSALKDPAVGLFNTYFGKDWSDEFVHGFLFPLSRGSAGTASSSEPSTSSPGNQQPVHNFQFDANGVIQPVTAR